MSFKTLIFSILATIVSAADQSSSVLVRSEITDKSTKTGEELSFTQRIPMLAGEMVVVFAKSDKGTRECYRRFIPKVGQSKNPDHWICSRGSTWLLQSTNPLKANATPGKGGPPFSFIMSPADETTLHIASEEGVLEVQMRSSSPTPFFFLMGKTIVGPVVPFKEGFIEPTDPWIGDGYRYQEHAFPGQKGSGLVVELRRPDSKSESLGVVTPKGETLAMDNTLDDDCARIFIASMTEGNYLVQPRVVGSKGAGPATNSRRAQYVITTRKVPDILKLLGIEFKPQP